MNKNTNPYNINLTREQVIARFEKVTGETSSEGPVSRGHHDGLLHLDP